MTCVTGAVYDIRKGDILFPYRGDIAHDHAAGVTANHGGRVHMAQHGGPDRTTPGDAIARNKRAPKPIASVVAIRPTGTR
ncbi:MULTISPECIES: hypothetical protein [unclassified Streptomyces]|uniref:hypothetical protein n=1 Tax=unclassified Streptomyces TaxID=2593676 RepID=UPI00075AF66F|nr:MULTISPECIES: hypothetical protein [unclassified Streptomyces]AQT71326.1 hypothetical protein B1K54_06165 [Streptomyces sp. fd1-xmd]